MKNLDELSINPAIAVTGDDEPWTDKLQEAWPHLRAAVWQRVLAGEALGDLAGVVAEVSARTSAGQRAGQEEGSGAAGAGEEGEISLTVGVLTRAELAETIAANTAGQCQSWLRRLQTPAPVGCIYVFGALCGKPQLWTLGPVPPSNMPN
jgi:hypothetical protein